MQTGTAPVPVPQARRLDRLIVTRPAAEAALWVQALQARGWPAQALPLIEIAPAQGPQHQRTLRHWRAHWQDADAIMFVSAAAVQHFFQNDVSAPRAEVATRFWAPGPGTAHALALALARLGIGAERIDAPADDALAFDSQTLWPVVAAQLHADRRVLIVRGASSTGTAGASETAQTEAAPTLAGNGRDWLIQRCQAAGARVQACVAYERRAPLLGPAQRALLDAAAAPGSVWLFSSSEALAALCALAAPPRWTKACALTTHPRIAAAARGFGFVQVLQTRPTLEDVMHTLESNWSVADS